MDDFTYKRLQREQHDEKLLDLMEHVNKLVGRSRSDMGKFHEQWDRSNDIYRGIRPPDKEDIRAAKLREPEKMIVPMTYAQVNTFAAFSYMLFYQNGNFFQINPSGAEDYDWRFDAELTLERDLRRNQWQSKLYQQLIDVCRFGIGVTKEWWVHEKKNLPSIARTPDGSQMGFEFSNEQESVWTPTTIYEGNRISTLSPYYFFPDTRRPLVDWQLGQFAADEREYDKKELRQFARDRIVSGIDYIEDFRGGELEDRVGSRLPRLHKEVDGGHRNKSFVCITEVHIDLVPSRYKLGPEAFPVRYLLWVANDKRIIRIEREGNAHQMFPYNVAQFSPDLHQQIGSSLSETIFNLQDVITWLINSRIWSVRRGIDGRIVADPEVIDADSIENRKSPVIWTRRSAPSLGIDAFIKQLDFVDTTAGHFNDVTFLQQLVNAVSGINENAMGQFHPGRRSATEARAVQAGAAGRMKMQASLIWHDAMAPLGRKLLLNQRQGMSYETYEDIIGETSSDPDITTRYEKFHVPDISRLARSEDFFVFDSTLDTEKGFVAQSLQELVGVILSNPEAGLTFDLDPKAMIEEILRLRGVGTLKRFSLQQNGLIPQPNLPGTPPTPQGASPIPGVPGLPVLP